MCFSPTASFIASGALAACGAMTLRKTRVRRELFLASVPLLFAAQQFIEGTLWLALLYGRYDLLQGWLADAYSVFVGIIWPLVIPLGLFMLEPSRRRKLAMLAMGAGGTVIAFYTLHILTAYGVRAEIAGDCLLYRHPGPELGDVALIAYVIITCAGFFISSHRGIQWLGIANILAFLAAYHFYRFHLVSVWCIFAAGVSGLIYLYFSRMREREGAAQTQYAA